MPHLATDAFGPLTTSIKSFNLVNGRVTRVTLAHDGDTVTVEGDLLAGARVLAKLAGDKSTVLSVKVLRHLTHLRLILCRALLDFLQTDIESPASAQIGRFNGEVELFYCQCCGSLTYEFEPTSPPAQG